MAHFAQQIVISRNLSVMVKSIVLKYFLRFLALISSKTLASFFLTCIWAQQPAAVTSRCVPCRCKFAEICIPFKFSKHFRKSLQFFIYFKDEYNHLRSKELLNWLKRFGVTVQYCSSDFVQLWTKRKIYLCTCGLHTTLNRFMPIFIIYLLYRAI